MAQRRKVVLYPEDKVRAERMAVATDLPEPVTQRCKALLMKAEGKKEADIAAALDLPQHTIASWSVSYIYRSPQDDFLTALGLPADIEWKDKLTEDATVWLANIVGGTPKDFGLPEENWSCQALADYISSHAVEAGYPYLQYVTTLGIRYYLDRHNIKLPEHP